MEQVVLVDEEDREIGVMEKLEAHRKGALHRAFSVLVFNSSGEILIQKRSREKYHSAGRWTNTCCSHPRPGESMQNACTRRLKEEMGINLQPEFAYKFIYRVELEDSYIEHELDHVYSGIFDGEPEVDAAEVEEWKFVSMQILRKDVQDHPELYTPWFRLILSHGHSFQHG